MQDLAGKAKEYINDHHLTTTLSSVDKEGNVDLVIVNTAIMTDPLTIKAASTSAEKMYENLKTTRKGMFMVIVPSEDPLKTNSIRIAVELIKDETQGEDFETMQAFVDEAYGGFRIQNLLTFRVTEIKPVAVW